MASTFLPSVLPTTGLYTTPTTGVMGGLGSVAGGAALGGLGPLLLPLLMSFGPSIISKLFGDKNAKLRKQIEGMLTPQYISNLTNQFYNQAISSPAYSQALGGVATGANQSSNAVAENLARSGITSSGTGAILSGLTPSLAASGVGQLKSQAYGAAHQTALDTIQQRIKEMGGDIYQNPSYTQQLFGGGLQAFGPYLQAWLKQRYPGLSFGS